jgi:hypothetical protein
LHATPLPNISPAVWGFLNFCLEPKPLAIATVHVAATLPRHHICFVCSGTLEPRSSAFEPPRGLVDGAAAHRDVVHLPGKREVQFPIASPIPGHSYAYDPIALSPAPSERPGGGSVYADMIGTLTLQSGALEAAHAAMTQALPTEQEVLTLYVRDFERPALHPGASALGKKKSQRVPCTLHLQRNRDADHLYGAASVRVKDSVSDELLYLPVI